MSTRTVPCRTRSKRACFFASLVASPTAAICHAGNSRLDELGCELLIHRVSPGGRVNPQVAEDKLGALDLLSLPPDGDESLHEGCRSWTRGIREGRKRRAAHRERASGRRW